MSTPTTRPVAVDLAALVDNSTMGRFQWGIFALCLACLIMDGFDVQALGYAAPALIQAWNIPPAALGPVFGAGNFGVLVGALLFSMAADKIGRRPVLIGATVFFSAMTLLTARATTVEQLLIVRFVAGIGLGCIIPNATALVGEYSPRRLRVSMMATISVGFTIGAAIGGFIAAWLIPAFGWQAVFYFGGLVPLAIAVVMVAWLPESLQFLALRGRTERVGRWLKQVDSTAPTGPGVTYLVHEENRGGVPFVHLFREGRAGGTLLIWAISFLNLINLYFLSNWLPTVIRESGYPTSTAVLVGTMLQVGGTLGTLWLAWLVSRYGFIRVLTPCFAVGAISVAAIGQPGLSLAALTLVVFIAGSCIVGGQPTINGLSGSFYPTYLRSTGIGWSLGIGRVGAIVGPVLGGEFLRRQWATQDLFFVAAVPVVVTAAAAFSLRWVLQPAAATPAARQA